MGSSACEREALVFWGGSGAEALAFSLDLSHFFSAQGATDDNTEIAQCFHAGTGVVGVQARLNVEFVMPGAVWPRMVSGLSVNAVTAASGASDWMIQDGGHQKATTAAQHTA